MITDSFLDTDPWSGRLRLAGLRARLRASERGVELTVKRPSAVEGLLKVRSELEGPATRSLEPGDWAPSAARDLVIEALGGAPLREIGTLRQRRLVRLVRRDATVVELSLDEEEALRGDLVAARRIELEAELKDGGVDALHELVGALATLAGLGPPLGSKLEFALSVRQETGR